MMLKALTAALALSLAAIAGTSSAAPAIIESAKDDCIVGERNNGYIGIIDEGAASDALRREVRSINQQRRDAYQRLASRNGVPLEAAAKVTAEKLINSAPSGHCVQNEAGTWVKKP
ncbi:MAG: YdbL family protein [Pseudomonadota bacterium]